MQKQIILNFDQQIFEKASLIAQNKGVSLNKILETYLQTFIWKENIEKLDNGKNENHKNQHHLENFFNAAGNINLNSEDLYNYRNLDSR